MSPQFGEVDNKAKEILKGAGHVIYMTSDAIERDLLKEAEKYGAMNLNGSKNDEQRTALVERIIEIITADSLTQMIKQEVETLKN